jgi:hypothetical protein
MVSQNLGNSLPPSTPVVVPKPNGWSGKFRVYWNGEKDALWSIDAGTADSEVTANEVRWVKNGILRTGHAPKADNSTEPLAWIEGVGIVRVENGVAVIWS